MTSKIFKVTCYPLVERAEFKITMTPKPNAPADIVSEVEDVCDKMIDEMLPEMATAGGVRGMIVKAVDEEGHVLYHNGRVHLGGGGDEPADS